MENCNRPSMYTLTPAGALELRCPKCGETLLAADVENFSRCPFCETLLPRDDRMEDFLLDPVVRHWMSKLSFPG